VRPAPLLLVGPEAPPYGGVATHVAALARLLRGARRVRVVDPHRGRSRLAGALAAAHLSGGVVHVHTHGHSTSGWLLALACAGARSLVTVHSGLAPAYLSAHPRLARAVTRALAHVVAVSPAIAEALCAAGAPVERVSVCPPHLDEGPPLLLPPPGLAAVRRRHARLVACALGDGPEYGASVLVPALALACARAPGLGALLYGEGARRPALADALARAGLQRAVHLLGPLPRERALAVVAAADVFVRPTLAEGDSVSVWEARSLGRPVVASRVGVRPPGVLTYAAEDPAALAELLFQVLGSAPPLVAATATSVDELLRVYARLERRSLPLGTRLASLAGHVRHRGPGQPGAPRGARRAASDDGAARPPRAG
jgi:glycosyltransferase involved in cell wall biosynthesis